MGLLFRSELLSGNVIGRGKGMLALISGVFGLFNIPLATLTVGYWNGNFRWTNFIFLFLLIGLTAVTWILGNGMKREEKAEVLESTESS